MPKQAIERFIQMHARELGKFTLDPLDLERLIHIDHILWIPHAAQELLSAEKTPTLSFALPIYEELVVKLQDLREHMPDRTLKHAIDEGIRKINEYIIKSRKSDVYALAIHALPLCFLMHCCTNRVIYCPCL